MSKANINTTAYEYNEIDAKALLPTYPDEEEYDLNLINFKSNVREFAREVYENGFDDRRKINRFAAESATALLSEYYELIPELIAVQTTLYGEKITIKDKNNNSRNPYVIGSFDLEFAKKLPNGGDKRYYCNCFRNEMVEVIYKIIKEIHQLLAGLGIPPKQL